jgi:hypothetical protein
MAYSSLLHPDAEDRGKTFIALWIAFHGSAPSKKFAFFLQTLAIYLMVDQFEKILMAPKPFIAKNPLASAEEELEEKAAWFIAGMPSSEAKFMLLRLLNLV